MIQQAAGGGASVSGRTLAHTGKTYGVGLFDLFKPSQRVASYGLTSLANAAANGDGRIGEGMPMYRRGAHRARAVRPGRRLAAEQRVEAGRAVGRLLLARPRRRALDRPQAARAVPGPVVRRAGLADHALHVVHAHPVAVRPEGSRPVRHPRARRRGRCWPAPRWTGCGATPASAVVVVAALAVFEAGWAGSSSSRRHADVAACPGPPDRRRPLRLDRGRRAVRAARRGPAVRRAVRRPVPGPGHQRRAPACGLLHLLGAGRDHPRDQEASVLHDCWSAPRTTSPARRWSCGQRRPSWRPRRGTLAACTSAGCWSGPETR